MNEHCRKQWHAPECNCTYCINGHPMCDCEFCIAGQLRLETTKNTAIKPCDLVHTFAHPDDFTFNPNSAYCAILATFYCGKDSGWDNQTLARGLKIWEAMARLKTILESIDFDGSWNLYINGKWSLSGNMELENLEAVADINWQAVASELMQFGRVWVATHIGDYHIDLSNGYFGDKE